MTSAKVEERDSWKHQRPWRRCRWVVSKKRMMTNIKRKLLSIYPPLWFSFWLFLILDFWFWVASWVEYNVSTFLSWKFILYKTVMSLGLCFTSRKHCCGSRWILTKIWSLSLSRETSLHYICLSLFSDSGLYKIQAFIRQPHLPKWTIHCWAPARDFGVDRSPTLIKLVTQAFLWASGDIGNQGLHESNHPQ